MEKRKVIYYTDELNEEFSLAEITPKKIDENYVYCHDSLFKKITHFFWYRIIATPLAFLYTKLKFAHKAEGVKKLRPFKKNGYFIYGNHTQDIGDALIPNMLGVTQDKYVIVHPNNVSMPFLGRITPSLGAIPLPDNMKAYKNFIAAIERRIKEGCAVVIYPEAHIWPYYTGIRQFTDASFSYPVKLGTPVFCFTNTYHERKVLFRTKVKIITYVDGPFYADPTLSPKEQREDLRNKVYACMCERARSSTYTKIQYIKKEQKDD